MIPEPGRWIFYFDLNFGEKFDYSVCGMSRSFNNPEKVFVEEYVRIVEEPTRKVKQRIFRKNYVSKAAYKKEVEQIRKTAQKDLELEIIDLRNRVSK
jgi:hypothetical protein